MRAAVGSAELAVPYAAKVRVPPLRANLLRRERLLARLHRQVGKRCSVISAPAGYGKSALLTAFANDLDLPVCWYSIDHFDRDPHAFIQYLIAAVVQRFPSACRRSRLLLGSPDAQIDATHLLGTFISEVQIDIPEYFVLVLDDVQALGDDAELLDLLDLLITRQPENCHLVLASRVLPSLPGLHKLMITGEAQVLRSTVLGFTKEEIAEVIRLVDGRQLSPEELHQLASMTEGWITAILLNAQLEERAPADEQHTKREVLYQLLSEEVWAKQPADVQELLLQTSILPRLSTEWCDELLGRPTGRQLARLAESNLFVFPLDEQGQWYHCHQLFREFLVDKLRQDRPEQHTALHRRAAELAEHRQLSELALSHYVEAHAYADAGRLLEEVADEWYQSGYWRRLRHWIDVLPSSVTNERPWLQFTRARVAAKLGDLGLAERLLNRALRQFEAIGAVEAQARCLCYLSMVARFAGVPDRARDLAEQANRLLPSSADISLRGEVQHHIALSLAAQGHWREAATTFLQALDALRRTTRSHEVALVHDSIGVVYGWAGRLDDAIAHLTQARQHWLTIGNNAALAESLNNLGVLYLYLGNFADALATFNEAMLSAERVGFRRVEAYARMSLADLQRDMGEYDEALAQYQVGLALAREVNEAELVRYGSAALAMLAALQGDLSAADILARQAQAEAIASGRPYDLAYWKLTVGIIRSAQRDPSVMAFLADAAAVFEHRGAPVEHARAEFQLARLYWKNGERDKTREHLERLAAILNDLGYSGFLAADAAREESLLRAVGRILPGGALDGLLRSVEQFRSFCRTHVPERSSSEAERVPQLEAFALGRAYARRDGIELSDGDWKRSKSKELFFFLLSRRGWVSEDAINDALWPDVPPGKVHSRFHSSLYQLRRTIGDVCLLRDGDHYQINPAVRAWYDVEEFDSLLQTDTFAAEPYEQATRLYHGPFFQECYSEWCEPIRTAIDQRLLHVLCALGEHHARQGNFSRAIALYERALQIDEWIEEVHLRLLQCYHLAGQSIAALKHYRRLVSRWRAEGLSAPSPQIRQLAHSIRTSLRVPLESAG